MGTAVLSGSWQFFRKFKKGCPFIKPKIKGQNPEPQEEGTDEVEWVPGAPATGTEPHSVPGLEELGGFGVLMPCLSALVRWWLLPQGLLGFSPPQKLSSPGEGGYRHTPNAKDPNTPRHPGLCPGVGPRWVGQGGGSDADPPSLPEICEPLESSQTSMEAQGSFSKITAN